MTTSLYGVMSSHRRYVERPVRLRLQQSKLRGIPCFGSIQKLGNIRRQVGGTYAYKRFDLHDTSEQEGHQGSQDGEDNKEAYE